jgi:hypothetical protein
MAPPRPTAQRVADARALLRANHADVWVASASAGGSAHLVPLSFAWDGTDVIIALKEGSPTARNIVAAARARLGFGTTHDVVMVDAALVAQVRADDIADPRVERYAAQADWDPSRLDDRDEYVYLLLRPERIQVWRESNELAGRTVMRDGTWVDAGRT